MVRHGETVDNVAQITAGSRDSDLTNHGFQQAIRLGEHFAALGLSITHIFSSHLRRAATTAAKIREAQLASKEKDDSVDNVPEVVQLPLIMEQDFGFYEGKKWGQESDTSRDRHQPGFVEPESKEAMVRRIDEFLDKYLFPIFDDSEITDFPIIAIVSHGRILSVMWKRLLARLPPNSVSFSRDAQINMPGYSLEHLGGWGNTGYLELFLRPRLSEDLARTTLRDPSPTSTSAPAEGVEGQAKPDAALEDALPTVVNESTKDKTTPTADGPSKPSAIEGRRSDMDGWVTTIETVNGRDHLKGLKRTRGGVGSARHYTTQRSIDSFFKKRRID